MTRDKFVGNAISSTFKLSVRGLTGPREERLLPQPSFVSKMPGMEVKYITKIVVDFILLSTGKLRIR